MHADVTHACIAPKIPLQKWKVLKNTCEESLNQAVPNLAKMHHKSKYNTFCQYIFFEKGCICGGRG